MRDRVVYGLSLSGNVHMSQWAHRRNLTCTNKLCISLCLIIGAGKVWVSICSDKMLSHSDLHFKMELTFGL